MQKKWRRYKYKNLTIICLSILLTIFVASSNMFESTVIYLTGFGPSVALLAGAFFTSTFTVTLGTVVIFALAERMDMLQLAMISGAGSVIADLTIFQLVRSKGLAKEANKIVKDLGGEKIYHLLHTRYFYWLAPILGAIIIASPLPDELGVGLMGLSKISMWKFIMISFVLNSIGIFVMVFLAGIVKSL
jgi:uncharacterized membrane protein YdjX (TVP38/TMEM64 family)